MRRSKAVALAVAALITVVLCWRGCTRTYTYSFRIYSANNLHQIGIAMLDYESEHGHLPPPAIYAKDGKALLSWRVLLLPYLEQEELYGRFRLDEPWDSPHNLQLLPEIPRLYRPVKDVKTKPHATFYQVIVGPGAAFETGRELISDEDFCDDISTTLLVVEAAEAVPWTQPRDLEYDEQKPLPRFGGLFSFGFNGVLADGRVQFFRVEQMNDVFLRAIVTRNGGETVDMYEYRRIR